jgi:hypothetical protein
MEVANLFKLRNKAQFTNALLALRNRYRDEDLVNRIQDVFMQRHSSIVKSAKKFAMAVREKYAQQNVPFHQLLMKARAHAHKHKLTDAEFAEFQRIYEQELAGTNSAEVIIPMTSMMKVLGNISLGAEGLLGSEGSFNQLSESDMRNLQEILKLNEASRPLHAQVLLQAIQYSGADAVTLNQAKFSRNMHNPGDHVHPVIAALFLPKIRVVDEHFIYSNMSGIVKSRYNNAPITTRPDYELLYNLITDPNDVICDTRSPMADLLHRCNLQNQLWNSVLHLRNGQYYNPSLREFMGSVDVCRLNKYDNPDLVYGRHDGTILKRLFSAFSFRPTCVATLPVSSLFAYNPYSQNIRPTVTTIPMINVRLSTFGQAARAAAVQQGFLPGTQNVPAGGATSLSTALSQTNAFLEGSAVVNRHTTVMFSREILVFYIDRRSYIYTTGTALTNLSRLPTSIAGFERINNLPITFEPTINTGVQGAANEAYAFTSAVIADVNTQVNPTEGGNYVVGSSAIVSLTRYGPSMAEYAPMQEMYHYTPNTVVTRGNDNPIISIGRDDASTGELGWQSLVTQRGVILVYVNSQYQDRFLNM